MWLLFASIKGHKAITQSDNYGMGGTEDLSRPEAFHLQILSPLEPKQSVHNHQTHIMSRIGPMSCWR